MSALSDRARDTAVIRAPITNLTIGASVTAFVASALVLWDDAYEKFFGFKPEQHPGVARAVIIAIIAAVTLMWIADVLAPRDRIRADGFALCTGAGRLDCRHRPSRPRQEGLHRRRDPVTQGGAEFLLVKDGDAPEWKSLSAIDLHT
jgi:hypothetical protein